MVNVYIKKSVKSFYLGKNYQGWTEFCDGPIYREVNETKLNSNYSTGKRTRNGTFHHCFRVFYASIINLNIEKKNTEYPSFVYVVANHTKKDLKKVCLKNSLTWNTKLFLWKLWNCYFHILRCNNFWSHHCNFWLSLYCFPENFPNVIDEDRSEHFDERDVLYERLWVYALSNNSIKTLGTRKRENFDAFNIFKRFSNISIFLCTEIRTPQAEEF